jgi:hypothetical protein
MLCSCSTQNQHSQQDATATNDTVITECLHLSSGKEAQNKWQQTNCPRGIPTATLSTQNPNIVGKNFVLLPEAGIEKAKLFNGDSLVIENKGCEFYELVYTLTSYSTGNNNIQDAAYWFGRGADLMLALQDSEVPFDLRSTSQSLKEISGRKALKINEEYTLSTEGGITQKAMLENFGKLPNGKGGFMKLKIFIGPL